MYVFILNQFGNRNIKKIFKAINEVCYNLKVDYKIEINSLEESTEDILKKYQDSSNIIIATGGDDMVNKVVNGIMGTNNTLWILPYGTGNDFFKTVCETLDNGVSDIDVMKINDKYFVNNACFGIDADIACDEKIIHNRFIPSSQRYNISVMYHFFKYKSRSMKVISNNDIFDKKFTTIVVAGGRYYGGNYKIGTNALLNDNLFDLYLIEEMPKNIMAKTILGMKNGSHEQSIHVEKRLLDKVTIESHNIIQANVDGEIVTSNHFDISIIPSGLKLYNSKRLVKAIYENK